MFLSNWTIGLMFAHLLEDHTPPKAASGEYHQDSSVAPSKMLEFQQVGWSARLGQPGLLISGGNGDCIWR